jgi:hypothetical protein
MKRRKLRLRRETLREFAGAELRHVAAGRPNEPGYTEPCITPRCPGDYTADCPY